MSSLQQTSQGMMMWEWYQINFFFSQSVIGFAIATIILSDGYVKKNCVVTFSWIVKLIFFSLSTCREQLTLKILLTTALTVN